MQNYRQLLIKGPKFHFRTRLKRKRTELKRNHTKFERPTSIEQLLLNLKLAAEQEWLLQPQFYDEETLRKFFNASTIAWEGPTANSLQMQITAEVVGSSIFPKMTVKAQGICGVRDVNGD